MKNKLIIGFVLGMLSFSVQSQTLSPTVISSSGGFYTSPNASLSFTVAEMTMVQTFSSVNNILTQGFQQAEDLATNIPVTPVASGEVLIYPNPTNGNFIVSYYSNSNSETTLKIYNLVGQALVTKTISQTIGLNTVNFNIHNFSQGIYLLELVTNYKGEQTTNYHKINLVY